jgi:hypothetical protein
MVKIIAVSVFAVAYVIFGEHYALLAMDWLIGLLSPFAGWHILASLGWGFLLVCLISLYLGWGYFIFSASRIGAIVALVAYIIYWIWFHKGAYDQLGTLNSLLDLATVVLIFNGIRSGKDRI